MDASEEDPYDLRRFVEAQEGAYDGALAELRRGRKTGHWMWFVLPQLRGLGRSPAAQRYGLTGLAEARAYAGHPVLGPRLAACARALLDLPGDDPVAVLGEVDALKLRSSMTLFARADPQGPYGEVLARYCGGEDPRTVALLGA
ncbi:DUF1810 domain-containing protein [Vallicoccus soli]|uniref:DUF1810 domain-containing protein n=1 Tax=Vallicoccus soli TaxID=2339232 RepID=A0A3A3ZFG4_9ACTN|nr:DUF1810 domain-containing protein [Vallicoccus soli]RJK93831.1 DUF1810 domain-containing protein [Vallicoccus soli]